MEIVTDEMFYIYLIYLRWNCNSSVLLIWIKNILGVLRLNSKDTVELIKGFKVGSQRTVIIKVPVIAYPPSVTSRFSWVDPKGQMINGTHVALLKTHEHYSYLITSVVLLPEVEHYGEYSVQYNGKPLTKIQITNRGNENDCRIMYFAAINFWSNIFHFFIYWILIYTIWKQDVNVRSLHDTTD